MPEPKDPDCTPIGLIGLGLMGTALADRLLERRIRVIGFDIDRGRVSAMANREATICTSNAGDVLAQCDLVLLSLPTHREVRALIEEHSQCFRPGQVIVDTTTGDPASAVAIAATLAERVVSYLDGTISGSSAQARDGDAVWMIGGDRVALERCGHVLRHLGREVFHTGPVGSGAKMKLVTNLVLGINRAALAEGLALAEALELDASETLRVLQASAAYSRIMDTKGTKMIARDFAPQARLSQHLKDVRLMLASGAEAGLELPLSATHEALLERAVQLGLGELDNSALIEVLRERRREP